MEIQQYRSGFEGVPKEILTGTSLGASLLENKNSAEKFSYDSDSSIEFAAKKTFSLLYKWLDSLTGRNSYSFVNSDSSSGIEDLKNIVEFLQAKSLLRHISWSEKRFNDAPFFHRLTMDGAYPLGITDGNPTASMHSIGFSKDLKIALSKVIGEFLERYFMTIYHKSDLVRSSSRLLQGKRKILDLKLLGGFSKERKKNNPALEWNEDTVFWWEKTVRLSTNETVFVPAQLIYWNYISDKEISEPFLRERNTSGCGGFFTKEGAILSGLYELVQRDAFMIWWLNSLTPPRINPESVPDREFQMLIKEARRYGFEVHCINTTLDSGIPSFVVFLENLYGKNIPHFAMGGGCEADPAKALKRSLEEAWSLFYWVRDIGNLTPEELPDGYKPLTDQRINQAKRTLLFGNPDLKQHYAFMLAGKMQDFDEVTFSFPSKFNSKKEELATTVRHIEQLGPGCEVYAYLYKHPALSQLGYFSARVIVPQFMTLYLNEGSAVLGSPRLKEVPAKMKLAGEVHLNTWPHPFP